MEEQLASYLSGPSPASWATPRRWPARSAGPSTWRHRAGVDLQAFTEAIYHAWAVTKERWTAVREEERAPGRPFPQKQAMAYFFAELEHALGLRDLPETPVEHAARKEAEAQEGRRNRDRHPDWARATGPRAWVQTYKPGEGLPALGSHEVPAQADRGSDRPIGRTR
jgi:hypothetical protein